MPFQRRSRPSLLASSRDTEKMDRQPSVTKASVLPLHEREVSPGHRLMTGSPRPETPGDAAPDARAASDSPKGRMLTKQRRRLRFRLRKEGESGRVGFHPWTFLCITFRSSSKVSMAVNVLWPVVPAAIACKYALSDTPTNHLVTFILAYVAMVPCANLVGFAGQELAHKMPHVLGILTETTLGSVVELVLFHVLLTRELYAVIRAAILGSILATMLLCLGLCFFVGGMIRDEQVFSETVSEAGTGLLLTAGFGLAVPTIFATALSSTLAEEELTHKMLNVSRVTSILMILSYFVFIYYQTRSHHGVYDDIFEGDETWAREHEAAEALPGHVPAEHHLTLSECTFCLVVAVTLVTLIALALVEEISYIVEERGISDAFMGLILVPVVEKAAEHLTAIDEAHDNQMNFALSHVLGATLQTAMFNGPLVVISGWGSHREMGLNFEIFDLAMLLLAIITVGNFMRDQKSNYLEGVLCVIVYVGIAVAAFNYPNPTSEE